MAKQAFGFAAVHYRAREKKIPTRLVVRALSAENDKAKLQALLRHRFVQEKLCCGDLKFGPAARISAGFGDASSPPLKPDCKDEIPRLENLGHVSLQYARVKEEVRCKGTGKIELPPLELGYGEQRQVFVFAEVEDPKTAYAVEVEHYSEGPSSGLTILFVPQRQYFR